MLQIETDIMKMADLRGKHEGLDKHKDLARPEWKGKPLVEFYMYKMAYYTCFKCKKPYFGGMKDCEAAAN